MQTTNAALNHRINVALSVKASAVRLLKVAKKTGDALGVTVYARMVEEETERLRRYGEEAKSQLAT